MKIKTRRGFIYRNGLTLAFLSLTLASLVGHALAGWRHENETRAREGDPAVTLRSYLRSGDFLSSVFENWESEFLQMGMFVLLTVKLRQKGSSESRPLDPEDESTPEPVPPSEQPWPVRRGGWILRFYQHSLSIALFGLFLASFVAHWTASWVRHAEDQAALGLPAANWWAYGTNATLWFESLQNWQSEFMSVVALCLLSIFLREKDSPQSKAVTARHSDTGK